jgi:uncharacterized protein YecT (DUF1311 family)
MSSFRRAAILALPLFLVSTESDAAGRPTGSQCDNEPTEAATFGCYAKAEKQLRGKVENVFRQRLTDATIADADARKAHVDGPQLAEGMRLAQAAWEKYVDAECGFEGQTSFGGSGDDILRMECRVRLGAQRLAVLNAAHRLLER